MDLLIENVQRVVTLNALKVELFKKFWEVRDLKKGEYLLYQGQVCRYDAFVLSGSLKGYFVNPTSYKEEVAFFAIEDWWATDLDSFHNMLPSMLNIQALEKTQVLQITKERFETLLCELPELERYFRVILQSYANALLKRIYLRNAISAKERYTKFLEQYPTINQKIPQYMIASYLGMSAEMLSKIRSGSA